MKHLGKNLVIVITLVAAGFFLAWLRFRPYLGEEAGYTDGERRYEAAAFEDLRFAVWEDPAPAPEAVNSRAAEGRPAVSPDGRWLVFAVGERGLNQDLWIAELVEGVPREAQPLAAANSPRDECAPAFGRDALYFASDRPGTAGGLDLFRIGYRDGVFGGVEAVPGAGNGPYDETDPAPLPGSDAVAFASDRPRGARRDFDLWLAPGGGADPEPIAGLNTPFDEREPAFVGDARTLLFSTDRSGGAGGFDLWRSVRDRGVWLAPEPLPGLNGPGDERGPAPSPDGFALWFSLDGGDGGDLQRAASRELFPVPGRPVGWLDLAILGSLLLVALLAVLAKRWETMDLIYKCVLAALLLHVLLLWWFRGLYPEGADVPLPGREAMFRIKLAAVTAPSRATNRAFGGLLDTDRAAVLALTPQRTRAEFEDAPVAAAPEREVSRAEAEQAASPERREAAVARAASPETAAAADRLARPREDFARRSADAPAMAVETGALARAADRAPVVTVTPLRAEVERPADEAAALPEAALARSDAAPVRAPAFVRAAAAPSSPAAAAERELAVAAPAETVERLDDEAREFRIQQPAASTLERGASAAAPERAGLARADLLDAPSELAMRDGGPLRRSQSSLDAGPQRRSFEAAPARSELAAAPEVRADAAVRPTVVEEVAPAGSLALAAPDPAERRAAPPAGRPAPRRRPVREAAPADELALPEPSGLARSTQREAEFAPPVRRAASALRPEPGGRGQPRVELRSVAEATRELVATETPRDELELLAAAPTERPDRPLESGPRRRPGSRPQPAADGEALPGDLRFERFAAASPERSTGASSTPGLSPRLREMPSVALRGADEPFRAAERTEAAVGAVALLAPPPALERPARSPAPRPARLASRVVEHPLDEVAPAADALVFAERAAEEPADGPARLEHTPYRNRFGGEKAVALREFGGSVETEAAVAAGLAYLARIQDPNGFWGSAADKHEKYRHVVIGKTGLGLLAFLGAGHTPTSGTEYAAVAERAVRFLLAVQDPETGHFGDSNAYSHGVTTYALAECYALTRDERLRAPLEAAVAWILAKQVRSTSPDRHGGWGYYYPDGAVWQNDTWPRVSVTSWQVMALESARLGGLEVPDAAFAAARVFLRRSVDREHGWIRYSHDPERLNSSYPTLPASTPAGLFAASLLGEDLDEAHYTRARAYLAQRAPRGFRFTTEDEFVYQATGNLYFWYYGTLASFRIGGRDWERWNERMKPTLLDSQEADGSWRPISLYARYAGDDEDDRSYTTAMCVLSLEIYYRYFTPLLAVD